jgi:S-adenosyl methyltransferase
MQNSDDPYGIVAALRDGLAPGSYLAMVHLSGDFVEQGAAAEAGWCPSTNGGPMAAARDTGHPT